MKRIVFALLAIMTITAGTNAQTKVKESAVPRAVLLAMENTYTSYSVSAWFEQPGQYVADFTTEGQKGKAYFTDDGEWQYSAFVVEISECPTIMNTYFVDNYPGFKIRSTEYIEEMSGDNYYRMIITRKGVGSDDFELIFDTRGKLTKTNAPDPEVVRRDFIARNNPEADLNEREAPEAPSKDGSKSGKKKKDLDIDSEVEKVTPPDAVKKNFEKRYPTNRVKSGPEWVMRDNEYYVAYFTNNAKVNFDAVLAENGSMIMVGTTLAPERYPRPIQKYLAEKLKGEKYNIEKVVRYDYDSKYRNEEGKKPKQYFYVVISQKVKGKKGKKYTRMTFDNVGKFTGLLANPLDEKDIR
ncbi:MAG: PepSY-like domain-containing protein [Bacteroidales bacterium]|nr:PepSY-like domain-containing protein [Bacteroidales bacterium]